MKNSRNLHIESSTLSMEHFNNLVAEQGLLLTVDNFLPNEQLVHFRERIQQMTPSEQVYQGGAPINRIGQPWFTTKHGCKEEEAYFSSANEFHAFINKIASPFQPPLDRLVTKLDRLWPGGAMLGKIDGRLMCAGLIRDINKGKSLPWHVDSNKFGPDGRRGTILDQASTYLFGNIYIQTDGRTGQLRCKDKRPNPFAYKKRNNTGFGADNLDMEADVVYTPQPGDLSIGFADKWHLVDETDGRRITVSCFIAVYDENSPLLLYS